MMRSRPLSLNRHAPLLVALCKGKRRICAADRMKKNRRRIEPDSAPNRALSPPLPMRLLRTREAMMQHFRPSLHAAGLTDQQGRILRVLAEAAELEMLELSARTCILPASLSRIVPSMGKKGLVRRRKDHADGRRVSVSITPRGRRVFKKLSRASEKIYRVLAVEIGAARLREFNRCIDDVIRILGRSKSAG
jgi:homoprotocatechuate degradation regulator HpaR